MAYSVQAIETPAIANPTGPAEFDLPVKEFVGYDPKGTKTVTGTPNERAETQNPKQETTTEVVAEAANPEESVRLAPKLSALARADQARKAKERALAEKERTFSERLADADKFAQLKAKLAAKDYSALEELGVDYDAHTQYLVDKKANENPEEQRYRTLEERQNALEKAQEERTLKDYQDNQALWKEAIATEFGDGAKYPNLSYLKSKGMKVEDDVLNHINAAFDEDGEEWTEQEAFAEFEKEAARRAELFAEAPVIKTRLQEPPKVLGAPKSSPKTITQTMTVTSQKPSSKPFHLMSESEQWEEARRRVEAARQQGR